RLVGDAAVVGDRMTAIDPDLLDDRPRCGPGAANTIARATGVIDKDAGAAPGQFERIGAAQAPTGARDDGDALVEGQGHAIIAFRLRGRTCRRPGRVEPPQNGGSRPTPRDRTS